MSMFTRKRKYSIPHSEHWEEIVDYILNFDPGKVLDIPSGNLWLTKILDEHGFECVADDICYSKITDDMLKLGFKYNASNLDEELPYTDQSFDYVVSLAGLEHISNPYGALTEFHRIVKEEGFVFINIPNFYQMKSRIRFLLNGDFSSHPNIYDFNKDFRHLHISLLPLTQMLYIASEIGFETTYLRAIQPLPLLSRLTFGLLSIPIFLSQKLFKFKKENTQIKQFLNSRELLRSQQLFIVLKKRSNSVKKEFLGDYGKYPSIGID